MDTMEQSREAVWWALGMDAIALAAGALHGRRAELDARKDLKPLFAFCKFHSITAIAAIALDGIWKECPAEDQELAQRWRKAKDQIIRKNILLDAERREILRFLESIGCWHMPLKGSLLQYDYPVFGMRQMSDNDILIDPAKRDEIRDFMVSRGYEVGFFRQGEVDTYQKPPVYNIEIHTALFSSKEGKSLERYYRDIRQKARKNEGSAWRYSLTDEDFYIYMVAHGYKHMVHSGVGIRYLLDVQVFLQKHGETLNWQTVTRELKKLGADDFERLCRSVCGKLLGDRVDADALTEEERALLQALFLSGTFGTEEQCFTKKLQNSEGKVTLGAKLKYMGKRLVPSIDLLQVDYPDIYEHKWKIPFILVWRVIRSIFVHPVKTVKELTRVGKTKDN